ncbi:Hypothetical protein IALB_0550 [Ignavibacterium album JCM 16511]|uniref:Glycosyltransferase RgtA/B/C/D-like domain-containing protein n=1 Tax=Ignavibacterium album (strain DSM 19864 / JCM 16511 / NBRC 101810 / Mat9-16) TaxID=945713 RepID=I0AH05_IGNAJ|nr:hypothetical protein [Ignavibacterium album]AFH48262.1 Hypothetical protein IALB_0550 [Ignavibacterium album JCM 16511]
MKFETKNNLWDYYKILIGFSLLIYFILLLKTAWLCDDAYITFRTVDNFVNGYGLRWNIAERVQTYTHPLWMFIVTIFYFFTKEAFFTSIILSIAISIITVYLILFKFRSSPLNKLIIILPILLSKALIDFSTSGLENSLSHLLFIVLMLVYLNNYNLNRRKFLIGLLSALILLNRMDYIFILIPIIIPELYKNSPKDVSNFIIGFLPFVIWEIFSLFYYGFPFPNTAYAKLSTGIPRSELIKEGLYYFKESFALDPITLTTIFVSFILLVIKKNIKLFPIGLGILFYLGYIIFIGGDFMADRFFTTPFVLSLVILSFIDFSKKLEIILVLILFLLFGSISIYRTINFKQFYLWDNVIKIDSKTVVDERKFYYQGSNLWDALKGIEMPNFQWVEIGKELKQGNTKYLLTENIGFQGYFAGHKCFLLDKLGLSDPLLSRLPSEKGWRIGHYNRFIPAGYLATLASDSNLIVDPDLSEYYKKLNIITRGELFSVERLYEIFYMNIGKYDYLIKKYILKKKSLTK